jgi:hypothetical protein
MLAFAAISTDLDQALYAQNVFKIQGSIFRQVPPLIRDDNRFEHYHTAQYYFLDSDVANQQRLQVYPRLNLDVSQFK